MKQHFSSAELPALQQALQQIFEQVELSPACGSDAADGMGLRFERSGDAICGTVTRRILVDGQPYILRMAGLLTDCNDQSLAREAQMFQEDLFCDFLTGAYNNAYWQERIAAQLSACAAEGRPACIALVDIDGLTDLNSQYGHADADQLIGYVANLWKHYYNEGTEKTVCRVGGGRLGIYCTGASAHEMAEQLRWLYSNMTLVCTSTDGMLRRIPFTLSIACAGLDENKGCTLAELTALCEQRLSAVKAAGGNAAAIVP